jgi:hypothetical protein
LDNAIAERRRKRGVVIKGEDLEAETILSLEEAYNGNGSSSQYQTLR